MGRFDGVEKWVLLGVIGFFAFFALVEFFFGG